MKTKPTLTITAVLAACVLTPPVRAVDVDEDGIDDGLEQTLIDMYRPILWYDSAQDIRPCSVEAFVRNSQLIWRQFNTFGGFVDHVIFTESQLDDPNDPDSPLLILSGGNEDRPPSNKIEHPQQSTYRINVDDNFWHGPPPPIAPVGMYAHVVPLDGPLSYTMGPTLPEPPLSHNNVYLLQYWQFLPANDFNVPGDAGDHEGDWLYVDILVDRACPYEIRHIVHHHHGDNHCSPTVMNTDLFPVELTRPFPLACDAQHVARIPQCYLEVDVHEWWPFPSDGSGECEFCVPCAVLPACCAVNCCFENRSHNGLGDMVESQNVLNLGERYAPMPGLEPQLIMFFNGLWGHDHGIPNGPSAGPLFQIAPNYPHCPLFVAHVDPSASPWSDEGLGSGYHPFTALADAIDGPDAVRTGGRVLIAPGNYSGTDTFSRAMRLEREGMGTVVIGP
jgi:hypothetical protein